MRTDAFPEGVPSLSDRDRKRVETDNKACYFILDEIQQLHDRGGGSIRENPSRSLHWMLPQEQEMMASGQWSDTTYSACCLMGARAKQQRLRHDISEMNQWPVLDCHRIHHPEEWKPFEVEGKATYPSHEEAEYTAYPCGRSEQAKQRWQFTPVFPLSKWSAIGHTGCSWTHEPCGNGQ